MAQATAIEWTDATWNPVHGCSKVSPGCAHCYAETLSLRYGHTAKPWTPANAAENVVLKPHKLDEPLRWRKPRMVFVNSMSDLFHEAVPYEFIREVFNVMRCCDGGITAATGQRRPRHTFQVLTKRPERMRDLALSRGLGFDPDAPPDNVWLGVSIENRRFVYRADVLRQTPAAVRFISAEPLLGPLVPQAGDTVHAGSPPFLDLTDIDWLIVGGESGPSHRPINPNWVRDLRDACLEQCGDCESLGSDARGDWRAGFEDGHGHWWPCERRTAFFFKQWGGRTPKAGGRELDGRTWDEMPSRLERVV